MAYQGYLIKVGNYTLPLSFIKAESYKVTRCGQDLDSYRDANGELHRTALTHFCNKVEFNTIPCYNSQMNVLMTNIRNNYLDATEKSANVTCYIPELDDYQTQKMYMPDIEYEMYYADATKIQYSEVRLCFIAY